jgi:GT2 family glycosyltransferase
VRLAVVVLNHEDWPVTTRCVESLERAVALARPTDVELVVVDNGSSEPGPAWLDTGRVTFLPLVANRGFGGGCNVGIAHALDRGADVIAVLNNDTEVDEAAITELLAAVDPTALELVVPQIRYLEARDMVWYAGGDFDRWRGRATHRGVGIDCSAFVLPEEPITFATGCAIVATATTWRRVGPFDERYFLYWEDAELSARLIDAGGSIRLVPQAIVWHRVGGGSRHRGSQRLDFYRYGSRNRLWAIGATTQGLRRWVASLATVEATVRSLGYLHLVDRTDRVRKSLAILAGTTAGLRPPPGRRTAW